MADPIGPGRDGARLFLDTPPLLRTNALEKQHGCELAIPNDAGIGNVLIYTRLVDDLARSIGKPLRLLTSRLNPPYPLSAADDGFALWRFNPHVESIVDAGNLDPAIMIQINAERDNIVQFGHMIENIEYHYGLRPSALRPSLYLENREYTWALRELRRFKRPVIAMHPYSTSASLEGYPWYRERWLSLIEELKSLGSMIEVGMHEHEDKRLGLPSIPTTLRQMFALIWASDVVVCFDSLISHVAAAFERPAVVLWDPTRKVAIEENWQARFALAAMRRWSYPQSVNIVLLSPEDENTIDVIVQRVRSYVRSRRFQ